jgi:FkbM family methyltransferase
MIEIKHYTFDIPTIVPNDNWKPCWYGLARLKDCFSDKAWRQFKNAEDEAHKLGYLGERELEVDLFISILKDIKKDAITFVELGAGYSDWCLALNGVIRNGVVPIKDAKCYAVEAEPKHVKWSLGHFKQWDIKGSVIPCAISDLNGWCDFAVDVDSSSSYGQGVTYSDGLLRTASNLIRRKSITVPCFTLDYLVDKYNIGNIDFIDMDVQGNEVRAVKGAKKLIEKKMIDYWKIGTHGKKYNNELKKMLEPFYDLIIDIYPYSVGGIDGLQAKVEDGIQVYKRKGL